MCISPLVVPARVASFLAAPPRQRSAMAGRSLTRQARAGLPWARALPPSRMLLAAFGERGRPGYRRCGRPRRRRCRISRDRLAAPSFRARAAEASGGAAQALQPYLAMSLSTEHPDEPLDCSLPQYAFCRGEKQLLRICMHSATSAGAALALQGCATGLLGAPPGGRAGAPAASAGLLRPTYSASRAGLRLWGMAGLQALAVLLGAAAALGHTLEVLGRGRARVPCSARHTGCGRRLSAPRGRAALANLCSDDPGEAVSEAINAAHKLVAATFVAGASHSFDRILFIGAPAADALRPAEVLSCPVCCRLCLSDIQARKLATARRQDRAVQDGLGCSDAVKTVNKRLLSSKMLINLVHAQSSQAGRGAAQRAATLGT